MSAKHAQQAQGGRCNKGGAPLARQTGGPIRYTYFCIIGKLSPEDAPVVVLSSSSNSADRQPPLTSVHGLGNGEYHHQVASWTTSLPQAWEGIARCINK